ncbi:MAG TPA: hypothetical protein VNX68_05270 [Nitrosopumilaceae archaeon]|nr:hypothetical protein [Nitrosopumilaceae archaeon]
MNETISSLTSLSSVELLKFPINKSPDVTDDELRYDNKLYDIVKKEIKNDTVYFYVLNDKKEGQLYAQLDKHIEDNGVCENNIAKSTNSPKQLNKTKSAIYFFDSFPSLFQQLTESRVNHSHFVFLLPGSQYTGIITPPPRIS